MVDSIIPIQCKSIIKPTKQLHPSRQQLVRPNCTTLAPSSILRTPKTERQLASTHRVQFAASVQSNPTNTILFKHTNEPVTNHHGASIKAAIDSGATTNCFPATFRGSNYKPVTDPDAAVIAQVANDEIIMSVGTDTLDEPALP